MPIRILITGASGFIGQRLFTLLADQLAVSPTGVVRGKAGADSRHFAVGDINGNTDWSEAVRDQKVVVHTAARAHLRDDPSADPLTEFRRVNVDGTLNLARQAAESGVKRFIFISSIGVNGNFSRHPFTEGDRPNPAGAYARSKLEAEAGLWAIGREVNMEIVILRPPLVYGPNAPGNFGRLVKMLGWKIPLPLGAVNNKRSLVAIDNLIDLITTCIDHPAAADQVFLAGDGEDLSTSELLRRVGSAMGKPARLLPVPAGLLQFGATILGKKELALQLLESLQVDISKARKLLNWVPPVSVDEGLRRCFKEN